MDRVFLRYEHKHLSVVNEIIVVDVIVGHIFSIDELHVLSDHRDPRVPGTFILDEVEDSP